MAQMYYFVNMNILHQLKETKLTSYIIFTNHLKTQKVNITNFINNEYMNVYSLLLTWFIINFFY